MKKILIALVFAASFAVAEKSKNTVDVEVVSNDSRAVRNQPDSLIGLAIAGRRTEQVTFGLNAIINGEHVKLSCDENHHGCPSFEVGKIFTGEVHKDDIWLTQVVPITNRIIRAHFKITGGW